MGDYEQVLILRQGTQTWNAWRSVHTSVRPDLTGADLSGLNLGGADLC